MPSAPDSLLVLSPDDRRIAALHYQYADQWLVRGRPEKAVTLLLDCCRLEPANLIYRDLLRVACRRMRPRRGLIGAWRRWRAARRLRSVCLTENWRQILQAADYLLAAEPGNVNAHLVMARVFVTCSLLEHAVWTLEQALVEKVPADSVVPELIRLCERTGNFTQAQALKNAPPRSTGFQPVPREFRHDAAIAEQKLAEQPDNAELQKTLARLRHEIQAQDIELLRQKVDRNPGDTAGKLEFGIQLLKAGQFDAALEIFLALRTDSLLAWRALVYAGYSHLNAGRWRRAKPLFAEALPLIPADAEATREAVKRLLAENEAR